MSYLGEISAREHYALRLMLRLAQTYTTQKPISLATIADFENTSVKYLEQLVMPFRKTGWLKSHRGRDGGYILIKDPKTISFNQIIKTLDNQHYLMGCLDKNKNYHCVIEQTCASRKGLVKIQQAVDTALDKITLAELNH